MRASVASDSSIIGLKKIGDSKEGLFQGYIPNILVIDDEEVILRGCKRVLENQGYHVYTTDNPREGLQLLREKEIDILILDLIVPGMDGLEILDILKRENIDTIPLVITAMASIEMAVEAMKKGALDLITKPFLPDQLLLIVKRAIERSNLEKETQLLRYERIKNLEEVAKERSRLRTIINCMADGVVVTDRDFRLILYNPALLRLLGLQDIEIGTYILNIIPHKKLREHLESLIEKGDSSTDSMAQEIILGPEGDSPYIRVHSAPIKDDYNHTLGIVSVLQDISYLRDLEQMKSDFISMVAHEIRTPVAAIHQIHAVLLKNMVGELSSSQRDLIIRAQARAEALLQLIQNLQDLTKIDAGRIIQKLEEVYINDLIREKISELEIAAKKKDISIHSELREDIPPISVDPGNMKGVIRHLIINAITFSPEGGSIMVKSDITRGYINFSIRDEGIGIAQEDISKIFDRFYRVKTEKTRKVVGSGLGLPIVKGIVEAHLGHIDVESELGKGTTFTVYLPIQTSI